MVERVLYDLAGQDDAVLFSPHGWRARMALAHKDLDFRTEAWRFTEKDVIAFSGQGAIPVLVDGERVVVDSWKIAVYLDEAYPDAPALLGGPQGTAHAFFVKSWAESVLHPGIVRQILLDLFEILQEGDKAYQAEDWALAGDAYGKALRLSPMNAGLLKQYAHVMYRQRA